MIMGWLLRAILKARAWWCRPANEEPFGRQLAVMTAVVLLIFLIVFLIDVVLPAMTRPR
jgi:hypothetical protein